MEDRPAGSLLPTRPAPVSLVWPVHLRTLLLAAVAVMAAKASDLPCWPQSCPGLGGLVTRFACAHCTAQRLRAYYPVAACFSIGAQSGATSPLPNIAVRLIWAFWRSKWRPWPAMSWPPGGVRHQPPGDMALAVPQITFRYHPEHLKSTDVLTHIAKRLEHTNTMHEVVSSNPIVMQIFQNVLYKYI